MKHFIIPTFLAIFYFIVYCSGWTALRSDEGLYTDKHVYETQIMPDIRLPRTHLHSIYKFGYCPPEAVNPHALRSTVNVSFQSYRDTLSTYIYVMADLKSTQRFKRQCIVMKTFVAPKFLFHTSRIPIYYCQGQMYIMMFNTVHRLALHEFYISIATKLPLDISLEFYHPYMHYVEKKKK